jgi:peptide deformylase
MAVREILLLGNEELYKACEEVPREDIERAGRIALDLQDTMAEFRRKYGFGRAIAAPQINEHVRMIYLNYDGDPKVLINPRLDFTGDEKFEVWDDCMSFPGLEVRLFRYKKCKVYYKNLKWEDCVLEFEGDLSELIQHEYDHLDGILAVQRAMDSKAFRMNRSKAGCY